VAESSGRARRLDVPILALTGFTAGAAVVGATHLVTGRSALTRTIEDGSAVTTWPLLGAALGATVMVPCATAAALAVRHSRATGPAAVVAAALLGLELLTQRALVGADRLQPVMAGVAAALAVAGARRTHLGRRTTTPTC
jgi:hypothetical protein